MKKLYAKFVFVLFFSLGVFLGKAELTNEEIEKENQKYLQAKQMLIEVQPALVALQKQSLNDKEILSGLAYLYARYPELSSGLDCSSYEVLRLALENDPKDKPSLFMATESHVRGYDSKRYIDF